MDSNPSRADFLYGIEKPKLEMYIIDEASLKDIYIK